MSKAPEIPTPAVPHVFVEKGLGAAVTIALPDRRQGDRMTHSLITGLIGAAIILLFCATGNRP